MAKFLKKQEAMSLAETMKAAYPGCHMEDEVFSSQEHLTNRHAYPTWAYLVSFQVRRESDGETKFTVVQNEQEWADQKPDFDAFMM